MIVFAGDNGGEVGSIVAPLRGKKGTAYEGGTLVPLDQLARTPAAGSGVCRISPSLMDIYPTLAAAASGGQYADPSLDGVKPVPYLQGQAGDPHESLYFATRPEWAAVKQWRWKLYEIRGRIEVYDMTSDLGEHHNVARQRPDVVAALSPGLRAWRKTLGPDRR